MTIFIFGLRYLYHRLFTNFYHLGRRVGFGKNVAIRNPKYISLGNNVYLDNNAILQVPEEHAEYGSHKPKLEIEDKVTVGSTTMISAVNSIQIKKNVLISQHCFIGDHNHEYKDINTPIRYQGLTNVAPIVIDEGAWIGANVTVAPGVKIGKNAVVGANSVVTKDVPDYSVAVGLPAQVIKKYNFKTKKWERVKS